ncbi:MAG: hypothetical protein KAI47_16965 [Deltaproteobacteria bacterium]|nr:hypothetical protein [Deltaproteobacteria bacterium]
MAYYCYKCSNELDLIITVGVKVGRLDTCAHCGANLHCCKNCRFYEPSVHNECLETHADFIRDREETNFCALYEIKNRDAAPEHDDSATKAKSKLEAMFKNLK